MWKSLFEKGITAGFSYVCLWLSGMGSVLFYQSAFGGQTEWSHVESTFLVLSIILWCWYYFRKKLRIPAVLTHGGTAVVFLFAYLRNQEEIFAGLELLANSVIEKWNYYYETGFWIFETGESGQEAMEITLLFLAMLIFWWGTVSLVCWKKVELLLLPGTLLFLLDLLVGYAPELKPMLFSCLVESAVCRCVLEPGKKNRFRRRAVWF